MPFFGTWLPAIILLSVSHLVASQQYVLGETSRLRNATLQDADEIATVVAAAFSPLDYWNYLYQFRHEFPKEHQRCVRFYVGLVLSEPSAHTEVIEAPTGSDISLAAVAMWTRPTEHNETYFDLLTRKCMHKDLNFTRAIDWEPKINAAKRKYVDDYFGTGQLYLELIATHPSHQLKGAGTRLVTAGLKAGAMHHDNVTLMAATTAETFYSHLGFESVKNVSISSVDNDRDFRFNVMAYDTSQHAA